MLKKQGLKDIDNFVEILSFFIYDFLTVKFKNSLKRMLEKYSKTELFNKSTLSTKTITKNLISIVSPVGRTQG